jgi:hypothetical protein
MPRRLWLCRVAMKSFLAGFRDFETLNFKAAFALGAVYNFNKLIWILRLTSEAEQHAVLHIFITFRSVSNFLLISR